MRGKPRVSLALAGTRRLIPAHAGKTVKDSRDKLNSRAHPRACGENVSDFSDGPTVRGSSPRMRGKPDALVSVMPTVGLIPAHAGKTGSCDFQPPLCGAHPRACGENSLPPEMKRASAGSSPRMRGKPGISRHPHGSRRLIPAHAGKTTMRKCSPINHWAHPRACGENCLHHGSADAMQGSSPRMRGKH